MEMTMTTDEHQSRTARSYKLLLLFAMISMTMMFAGLTSAFVVSKSRADWLKDFQLPSAFYFSTALIIGCSLTFHLAKKAIQKNNQTATTTFLLATLALGIGFVILQFVGFGYNSTQTLGIELGAMYWHFLDLLWVYLFLFLYFFK